MAKNRKTPILKFLFLVLDFRVRCVKVRFPCEIIRAFVLTRRMTALAHVALAVDFLSHAPPSKFEALAHRVPKDLRLHQEKVV